MTNEESSNQILGAGHALLFGMMPGGPFMSPLPGGVFGLTMFVWVSMVDGGFAMSMKESKR